jgi:NAD/NADP transhydrogenase alpha subunit
MLSTAALARGGGYANDNSIAFNEKNASMFQAEIKEMKL